MLLIDWLLNYKLKPIYFLCIGTTDRFEQDYLGLK